jgi:hypothetical protein
MEDTCAHFGTTMGGLKSTMDWPAEDDTVEEAGR